MLRIIHTNTHFTVDQMDALRQHVIAQLADGNDLVVLPLGCTIELIPAAAAYTDVTGATSAIVAAAVSRYEATMKAWGRGAVSASHVSSRIGRASRSRVAAGMSASGSATRAGARTWECSTRCEQPGASLAKD